MILNHPFNALYNKTSKVLILGSFPSVKSREQNFFYGHPQNRFWKVLAAVLDEKEPETIKEKSHMLLSHGIALWDVIKSCEITGSSDSSIKNVTVNDIQRLLNETKIEKIFVNGKTAEKLYIKHIEPKTKITAECLPSTSAANAAFSIERLTESYMEIKKYII